MTIMEPYEEMDRYQITVGLNDAESKVQEHNTETFESVIKKVCKGYHVAFSLSSCLGGYYHEDQTYVSENSLILTLIGAEEYMVEEISKDICAFFHQECVMVTHDKVFCRYVSESLE